MAEAFATAAAALGLFEQCIRLSGRVRSAVERQNGLVALVDKNVEELQRTRTMINLVINEEALQTHNVDSAIARLEGVGRSLERHLQKMVVKRGRLRGFFAQLVSGQRKQDALEHILLDLERSKHDLSMYIQLANVGLIRRVGEAQVVSVAAVDMVNRQLQAKLGSTHSLRISKLLAGRPMNPDGTVTLTEEDVALLSAEPPPTTTVTTRCISPGMESESSSITVRNNEVSRDAIQLNSPIGGASAWERAPTIRIEGNRAVDRGFQLNHPMSTEGFMLAMELRRSQLARAGPDRLQVAY